MTQELASVIVIVIGLAVTALGIWILIRKKRKDAVCTEEVTAELLHYETQEFGTSSTSDRRRNESGDTTYYYPVFRYIANGEEKAVQSSSGRNSKRWKEGSQVPIRYNPEQPANLVIVGDKNYLFSFIIAELLGITSLVCGILGALGELDFNL